MQFQVHAGCEIQADRRVAPGAQALFPGAPTERLPEPGEGVAQGRPALPLPALGPEERGELLAAVQTALGRKIKEQRKLFTGSKPQEPPPQLTSGRAASGSGTPRYAFVTPAQYRG